MRIQLHKLEGMRQVSGFFFFFSLLFFQIGEKKNTHFYVSTDAGASVLPSLLRWHSGGLSLAIFLYGHFTKLMVSKFFFPLSSLTPWPRRTCVIIMVSFLLMVLFVKVKINVCLPPPVPVSQWLCLVIRPPLIFPLSSLLSSLPSPCGSSIPKKQESPVFQMCRNNLFLEQHSQTVGYDFRWL